MYPAGGTANKVQCNDSSLSCPDNNTCCLMKDDKSWGCCTYPQAVCCSDRIHCCPSDYTCDFNTFNGTCIYNQTVSMMKKLAVTMKKKQVASTISTMNNIHCCDRDTNTSCPEGNTCCPMKDDKSWGCCLLPEAVCCSDHTHCCPSGYTCDTSNGTSCIRVVSPIGTNNQTVSTLKKLAVTKRAAISTISTVNNVQCDCYNSCPNNSTCCESSAGNGTWSCCPMPNAVCCPDHKHCCPNDYACNDDGTCTDLAIISMKKKHKAAVIQKAT
jgi:hypothetical protein